MIIGIDAREAHNPRSGKAHYTLNIIKYMIAAHPECHFVLYSKNILRDFERKKNVECVVLQNRHFFWHLAVMRDWMRRSNAIYFAPTSFIIPALLPKRFKRVITVHDLIAFREKTHQAKAQLIEKLFAKRATERAERIMVPSTNTARDLEHYFPQAKGEIVVTPLGVERRFVEVTAEATIGARKKYQLPETYILTVGGLEPRKNIVTLIKAFLGLEQTQTRPAASSGDPFKLVIVGGMGWSNTEAKNLIEKNADKIMHLTHVTSDDLPALYAGAQVFVFPSLYEGFGLPTLEAMASGCPVICSNASSLPEVCGDAAVMFDPQNVDELQEKLGALLKNTVEQDHLRAAGSIHAQKFTWERCAELTLKPLILGDL